MLKKSILILIVLCLTFSSKAQMYWRDNLDAAKSLARQTDKLILLDFWAVWCGPCNKMEAELWNNPEMQQVSKSFIGVKVDVDYNKSTAMFYNAKSIPKIVLISFDGEKIWETVGFRNAESYLSILRSIPENVKKLNHAIQSLEENKKDSRANFLVGSEFQNIGKELKSNVLKSSFLISSEKYFSKALKYSGEESLTEEIELNSILNDVYSGKPDKALKKIEKIKIQNAKENVVELRHFILAKCYKDTNDPENYQKERQLINKKEFIDQLDD